MTKSADLKDKYVVAKEEQQKYIDAILKSKASKKIVVAGPGTGKTSLFREILRGKGKTLTLTFINSLVGDLSLELYGLSEVRTLHSFARGVLKDAIVFPKLSEVIKEDAKLLKNLEIDFDKLFYDRDDENKNIKFYTKRRTYYNNHFGYTDLIFEAVKFLEHNREEVLTYDQVVIDEFQDFNKLEVSLIDLLAEKSPILLVGDDDQALYDFKIASAKHLQHRYGPDRQDYESFTLPYCFRCTRVVVEATNDFINTAMKSGFLKRRISKPYRYFDDEKKDAESDKYPKVAYAQLYARQIPWFIKREISEIAKDLKSKFSVLVISPTNKQSQFIAKALKGASFRNVEYDNMQKEKTATLLDGLKILIENEKSNLGWRIVSRYMMKEKDFALLLKETDVDGAKDICEIINSDCKNEIKGLIKVLRKIKNNDTIGEDDLGKLLKRVNLNSYKIAQGILKEEINSVSQPTVNAGIRKIPIKTTTIQSSKGLSADFVFITNFEDQYFVRNKDKKKISDYDICCFIVALTRTQKKVFLISAPKKDPTFLKWIQKDKIEWIKV